jgi:ribosomal protein S18 acetylase RimI-like enzyme
MSNPLKIRTAAVADAAAILELESHFPSDRMSARSVREFLRSPASRVLIAEMEGRLVGNLILLLPSRWRTSRIYSVVVDPAARGLGVGRALVLAAEQCAQDAKRDSLFLEVRVDNAAARAMYEKLGYVQVRELPGFYEDGADGLRLSKPLARQA